MERNCSFNYQNINVLEIKLLKYKDTVSHLQSYDLKIGNTVTEVDAQKKANNYLKKKKSSPWESERELQRDGSQKQKQSMQSIQIVKICVKNWHFSSDCIFYSYYWNLITFKYY